MGTNLMGELVANNGSFIVNGTPEVNKTIDAIVVLEDTIFTTIKINNTNVTAEYIQNAAIPVRAGAIITPINDFQFSGVKLVSGSVALVLG
jgi:hypothetical protein